MSVRQPWSWLLLGTGCEAGRADRYPLGISVPGRGEPPFPGEGLQRTLCAPGIWLTISGVVVYRALCRLLSHVGGTLNSGGWKSDLGEWKPRLWPCGLHLSFHC